LIRPVITSQALNHPMLRDVNLRELNISRAKTLTLPRHAQVLAEVFSHAVFAIHRTEPLTTLVLGFSLRNSDLVWRPALPLLLDNALALLAPRPPSRAYVRLNAFALPRKPTLTQAATDTVAVWPERSATAAPESLRRPARWALAAALLLALSLWISALASAGKQSWWRVLPPTAILAATAVALSDPRSVVSRDSVDGAVVVEAPGRMDAAQLAWAEAQLNPAASQVSAWAFGAKALQVATASAAANAPAACLQAQAHLHRNVDDDVAPASTGDVIVLTDSVEHSEVAQQCRFPRGVRFLRVPSRRDVEAALGDFTSPAWVAPAQTFAAQLPVQSTAAGHVTLQFAPLGVEPLQQQRDDGQQGAEPLERMAPGRFRLAVIPGATWVTVSVPGHNERSGPLSARIVDAEPRAAMGLTQNDFAVARPAVRQRPSALIVTPSRASILPFIKALQAQAFEVVAESPQLAPPAEKFDLVVLSDVSRSHLSTAWLQDLMKAVDAGTGLLVAGGPRAFGAGGWKDDPAARILPVLLDLPAQRPVADLALALVVDRSGSMGGSKIDLTREAVRATSIALRPSDLLTVIAFDSRAEVIVPLQMAANRARIWGQLDRLASGGGTNLMPALHEAHASLVGASARRRHMILLSDGHTPAGDLGGLLDQILAADITISTVAVGRGADVGLLRRLADAGGGRLHVTEDAAHIPRIFTSDVAQAEPPSGALTTSFRVRTHHAPPDVKRLNWRQAPPLQGLSVMRPRKQATVLVEATSGEPVLVKWNVGSGLVATFAADVAGPWSAAFTRWGDYSRFWAAVARALLREDPQHTFPIHVERVPGNFLARLEPTAADGEPWAGLTGTLNVVANQDEPNVLLSLPLRETTPGRYQAHLPADRPASAPIIATLQAKLDPPAGQQGQPVTGKGHIAWPYASEYRLPPTHSGGISNHKPDLGLKQLSHLQRKVDTRWAPWLSLLTALLFVAEIGLRRATFRASKT
jgi:uncharacterized membrane protein